MTPETIAPVAAAVAAAVSGELLRRQLNTLHYRRPAEAALPAPGTRAWVPWVLGVAVGGLVWRYTATGRPDHLVFLIPFAVAAMWLSAVDLDVQRIPFKTTLTTALLVLSGLLGVAVYRQDATLALTSLAGGVLAYGTYWALHKIGNGGIGYGDVRYAGLIGLTCGALTLGSVWIALLTAGLSAALWTAIKRTPGRLPYAPWLSLGSAIAIAIA